MQLPKHLPSLDGMRGIAILLVILTHCGGGWQAALSIIQDTTNTPALELPKILSRVTKEASHGVQLFFVVSAFTLTLRAAERKDTFFAYAARRIARVGPAYWLAGLLYFALVGFSPRQWAPQGVSGSDIAFTALFLSAWQGTSSLAIVPGGWSVSCEVAFYAILPILSMITFGRPIVVALLCALSVLVAILTFSHAPNVDGFSQYVKPTQQLPVFLMGILAATVCLKYPIRYMPQVSTISLILAIFVTPVISNIFPILPAHIVFSMFAAIAVLYGALFPLSLLTNWIIVRVGMVSYSMYLVHFALLPIGMKVASLVCPNLGIGQLIINFAFTSICAFAVSNVTYRFIEQPPMRWMAAKLRRQGFSRPIQKEVPT